MEPRRLALFALLAFVVLTGASIVVSGSRSGAEQGDVPWLLQVVGYLFALAAGVRLAAHGGEGERRTGFVVLGALVVLVLVDAVTRDDAGAAIGPGLLRVVCLAAIAGAALRLAAPAIAAGGPLTCTEVSCAPVAGRRDTTERARSRS